MMTVLWPEHQQKGIEFRKEKQEGTKDIKCLTILHSIHPTLRGMEKNRGAIYKGLPDQMVHSVKKKLVSIFFLS